MTTQHKDNLFRNMNTNLDGGNRVDQDSHGPYVFTLLEVTDLSDQMAPEPVTKTNTTDLSDRVTRSVDQLNTFGVDDFQPFSEDESDDSSSCSGSSTVSSETARRPNINRFFISSGAKLNIGHLEEACAWLSSQAYTHNKNDRSRLAAPNNIIYRKVFEYNQGHEVINYWNNEPVLTAAQYEDYIDKQMLRLSEPVLICEMIKFTQELAKVKSRPIFYFASPIEASKFFKNHYNHINPISPALAAHPTYKPLFEVSKPGEAPRPAKTVQELMNGTHLYFLTLQATYDGSALSHHIQNDETDNTKRAAVQAYVMNQKIDVFDASLTVMTDDPILPFKEALLPILQDNLFWSCIHATSGPTITTNGTDNILPDLNRRGEIKPGHRLNSVMINNKHDRAKTISQFVALNRENAKNKDHYYFCPNHRNKSKFLIKIPKRAY